MAVDGKNLLVSMQNPQFAWIVLKVDHAFQITSTRHSMLANRRISPALMIGCRSTSLTSGNASQPDGILRKTPFDDQKEEEN